MIGESLVSSVVSSPDSHPACMHIYKTTGIKFKSVNFVLTQEAKYRGLGRSSGRYHNILYFNCETRCGEFVAVDRLSRMQPDVCEWTA